MKCREATDMILKGERNHALEEHLEQCPECRSMNEDFRRISELARMPLPDVPEELDKAVLACAAAQKPQRPAVGPALFFRLPVLRAAAAVAVLGACAALTFSAMTGGRSPSVSVRSAVRPGVETVRTGNGDVLDFLEGSAELDADLLTLSVELDQTESDLQLMASASTPSWYPAAGFGDF